MDKSAIRNYAVAARRKLMDAVRQKAFQLYITEDGALPPEEATIRLRADNIFLSPDQQKARLRLVDVLAALGETLDIHSAYQHVIEEVAYTWFNRLIALRFMEVNESLPSSIRILSSLEQGRAEPDALREAERLDFVDQAKIAELRSDVKIGAAEKLYKYILISQCNALSAILPGTFQKLGDYTELLLPDTLYIKGGIVYDLVNAIAEDDFRDQVQIIGWLYQYYISEKKDEVFAALKNNVKITKETIPAATQLFTPEWIVKYMVENSLGRLWLESGLSKDKTSAADYGWKYYVEEAEQEPEVAEQLRVLRAQSPIKRPEDIKLIDPCMGSGHILAYAFDVLYQIYQSSGYAESSIPNLILNNNIYGLDIDDRAGQLAYFALMMKARSYHRRFFRQESIPQPMVYAFVETDGAQKQHLKLMGQGMMPEERQWRVDEMEYLMDMFVNAREYGSIIKIERKLDYEALRRFVKDCALGQMDWQAQGIEHTERILLSILDLAETLARKYDVVVTNPPYMGSSGMDMKLAVFVKKHYPDVKSDMSTVCMAKSLDMCKGSGYMAMINIPVWMFLSSYEKLRNNLVAENTFVNMVHFGRGVFGSDFGTTSFIIGKQHFDHYTGRYRRLFEKQGAVDSVEQKEKWFLSDMGSYNAQQDNFLIIPGTPIAYWVSDNVFSIFGRGRALGEFAYPRQGLASADNNRFLKLWYEVDSKRIDFVRIGKEYNRNKRWFPFNKGGEFRKWYGNREYIINWENNGEEMKSFENAVIRNSDCYFNELISYSDVTSGAFSIRYYGSGFIFDSTGPSIFNNNDYVSTSYLLGAMNSNAFNGFLAILCPTIHYTQSAVAKAPIIYVSEYSKVVEKIVQQNMDISKYDWDSFETSWDYKLHPLLQYGISLYSGLGDGKSPPKSDIGVSKAMWIHEKNKPVHALLETSFNMWQQATEERFNQLKSNEEELNRIFIDIYGLQNELTPEVEDKDVTIRKADLGRDIRSFVSYAVGCMFGRYSLDEPGLIFAGGQFDMSRYKTYLPEDDNIIPIGSADYFNDDIVVRFTDFVRIIYGDETLSENLTFIANALYPNIGSPARDKIRRYFLNDFFKDHTKIYQKRPIYWLLDSGKMNGFKALIYLHRYDKYTIARVRTDYLHLLQNKYEEEIKRLDMMLGAAANAREKAVYSKEIELLQGKLVECRVYDQVVSHIAHRQIELDLDDGVVVNYAKLQGVEVPKDNGKTVKMDLLAKM